MRPGTQSPLSRLGTSIEQNFRFKNLFPIVDLAFLSSQGFPKSRADIRLRPVSARQVVFCNRIAMSARLAVW
jgi:hypothetical protein